MKMASQRFCLRWNNHQSNLLSVFTQLLSANQFTDVTLAVEGRCFRAHKVVLSACSPYFNTIFAEHPDAHPVVVLRDVPVADMKALLDFMYRGEVSVDQERLTAFLRVAESLRIKGLTEVNDDKPAGNNEAAVNPAPPQLQRIQPTYGLQQQQSRSKQGVQQNSAANTVAQQQAAAVAVAAAQQNLLSSALAAMPKRKRGRPRKLSGSSNGTGNDYDEYEREGMMNDSDMGDSKMGNESYSGNDDNSEDNLRIQHSFRLNEDTYSPKKNKLSRDSTPHMQQMQQNDENSTTVQSSPELSQRLFGKTHKETQRAASAEAKASAQGKASAQVAAANATAIAAAAAGTAAAVNADNDDIEKTATTTSHTNIFLPTVLGLQIRAQQKSKKDGNSTNNNNSSNNTNANTNNGLLHQSNHNSLLKQQLRAGLKEIEVHMAATAANTNTTTTIAPAASNAENQQQQQQQETQQSSESAACSALQSLASVAERQLPNAIQPPSANNLHQQFLMHMAANPMLKSNAEFFQQQQQQLITSLQQQQQQQQQRLALEDDDHENDKSEPELTLVDESAGLEYKNVENDAQTANNNSGGDNNNDTASNGGNTTRTTTQQQQQQRPVQRRRIRRKAQSTNDDQAEHLTEMSVRGLDLFRYASINEGVYQCTECAKENMQKTFKNKYSFQRHAFLYHEGKHRKVFPCPLCGKEFSRPDKMKNHMKMTHDNAVAVVAKDVSNSFNPLNYLITAAAAGEIHSNFMQQQQQQLEQQQLQAHQQLQQSLLANSELTIHEEQMSDGQLPNDDDDKVALNYTTSATGGKQQQPQQPASSPISPAIAMLKLHQQQHEIFIKNEIVISPSPSPPPANRDERESLTTSTTTANAAAATLTQTIARLEEVK